MRIVADTHVHVYPCHELAAMVNSAAARLSASSGQPVPADDVRLVLCLTERHDCHVFRNLRQGEAPSGLKLVAKSKEAIGIEVDGGVRIHLLPGRQIVTRERLEVLSLLSDSVIPDGLDIGETLKRVQLAGGVPVLPWSPGKWSKQRGRILAETVARAKPGTLVLGDTTLRPIGWPEPSLMRKARKQGFKVVAGSDPLPFRGEESRAGSFGVIADVPGVPGDVAGAVRRLLTDASIPLRFVGRRNGPLTMLLRWLINARVRKNG